MSAALSQGTYDCQGEHVREFDLNTGKYRCERCLADWEGLKPTQKLYCAAFMVKTPKGWEADMLYMHHESVEDARLEFFRSETRVVRQVQIAPVVGWFADDAHGDKVSA